MQTYRVIAPLTLHTGGIALTDAQAEPRANRLQRRGEGVYEVVLPVQFKAGEEIGYEGDLPKALATMLAPAAEAAAAEAAAAEAAAADKPQPHHAPSRKK